MVKLRNVKSGNVLIIKTGEKKGEICESQQIHAFQAVVIMNRINKKEIY